MKPIAIEIQTSRGTRVVHLRAGARLRLGSRSGSSDVVFERERELDPLHLTLYSDGVVVTIEDAGSSAGTWVNGRRIRRQQFLSSDTAKAAGLTIRITTAKEERTESARPLSPETPKTESIRPAIVRAPPRAEPPVSGQAALATVVPGRAIAPSLPQPSKKKSGLAVSEWPADEPSVFRRGAQERLFAILDLARDRRIQRAILTHPDRFENLYEGNRALQFTAVAPYLVEFDPDSKLFAYLLHAGWGNSWGVYLISTQDFFDVRRHLRRFLTVQLPEGRKAYFRFYDPRVLRSFLPVCETDQIAEMFAAVSAFVAEADNPAHAKRFEFTPPPAFATVARGWRR